MPWPENCKENLIWEATRNKDSDETVEETYEAGIYVASSSNESKSKEQGNYATQNDNGTDEVDADNEACGDERPTFTGKDSVNVSEDEDEIGKNGPKNMKASISSSVSSKGKVAFSDDDSEKQTNYSETEDVERLPNPKPDVLVEINSSSNRTKNIRLDEDVTKKDIASDVEKEENIEGSFPGNHVSSIENERQENLNESKNKNESGLNITCDPSDDKPVNSTERENGKDINKVRPRKNAVNKATICELL